MSASCGDSCLSPVDIGRYRRVLYAVIAINLAMFVVEATAGLIGRSVALHADALDFLGDSVSYAVSLFVLGMSVRWRAGAAIAKGLTMGAFGLFVLGESVYFAMNPGLPGAGLMASVGTGALVANLVCAVLLFRHRNGDSNMRSVWLCTRNDALGNIAVIIAASGVFWAQSRWPDLVVGCAIAALALFGCVQILRQACREWADAPKATASPVRRDHVMETNP